MSLSNRNDWDQSAAHPTTNLDDELSSLREEYATRLPEKIAGIEESWEVLQTNWDPETFKEMCLSVHRLAGSGATFGFPEISQAAQPLDAVLIPIRETTAPLTDGQQSAITTLLKAIRQALHPVGESIAQIDTEFSVSEPPVTQANRLIFVVEDDPAQAQDLSAQIGRFGYTAQVFGELAALKEAVRKIAPSAIIMDVVFPEGDLAGIEAIKEIRELCKVSPPVICVSVRNDLIARLAAVRAGADGYFTKPINVFDLVDALDRLTARQVPEPYRVLIVDDDKELTGYYSFTLEQAGIITHIVNDPLQVMEPLIEFAPDVILMDVYMPGCSGPELTSVIRQQANFATIPIVFLSVETNLESQMLALYRGGDDFVTKPIEPHHLLSSVISRAQRSRVLRSLATFDGLTGLLTHRAVLDRMDVEIARAWRHMGQMACAMVDLDHFKRVNDTYGHATGDHVLQTLARLFKQHLRQSDVLGRYGGEEFILMLTDTDGESALRVMNGIREDFGAVRQQTSDGTTFPVTLSCGIATFPTFSSVSRLTEAADKALYRAKAQGRNCVVLAE